MAARRRESGEARARALYRQTFETDAGKLVLADLRAFCMADHKHELFDSDAGRMAANVGRFEVWQRIAGALQISDEDLERAATRAAQIVREEDWVA